MVGNFLILLLVWRPIFGRKNPLKIFNVFSSVKVHPLFFGGSLGYPMLMDLSHDFHEFFLEREAAAQPVEHLAPMPCDP